MKRISRRFMSVIMATIMVFTAFASTLPAYAALPDATTYPPGITQTAKDVMGEYYDAMKAIEDAGATRQWAIVQYFPSGTRNLTSFSATTDPRYTDPQINTSSTSGNSYALVASTTAEPLNFRNVINDTSDLGLIFNAAVAFERLLNPANGVIELNATNVAQKWNTNRINNGGVENDLNDYPFPWTWWSNLHYIMGGDIMHFSSDLMSLNGAFTNMKVPNTHISSTKNREKIFSKDAKWRAATGTSAGNFASSSAVMMDAGAVVNRTEAAALRSDVPDLAALLGAANVRTQIKFGVKDVVRTNGTSAVAGLTAPSGSAAYNVFGNQVPTTYVNTATMVNALKNYYNWFLAGGRVDANPFLEADIATVASQNATINNAVANVPADLMDRYFGTEWGKVAAYIAESNVANSLGTYAADVDYYQAADGFIDSVNDGTAYDPTDLLDMTALLAGEQVHLDRLSKLSDNAKTELVAGMGLDWDAIKAAHETLLHDIQLFAMADLKAEIEPVYAQYHVATEDYSELDVHTLGLLLGLFEGYCNRILAALNTAVTDVFQGDELLYVDFYARLKYQAQKHGHQTVTKNEFRSFFEPVLTDDLSAKTSKELMSLLNAAEQKKVDYAGRYAKAIAGMTPEDLDLLYDNYDQRIDLAIDLLGVTLAARFTEEVALAEALYDGTNEVTWDNVSEVARMVGMLEGDIYTFLDGKGVLDAATVASYLRLKGEIWDEYVAFTANGGFDHHEGSSLAATYPTRTARTDDLARQTGEDYDVTADGLQNLLKKLDGTLGSSELKNLGFDLSDIITKLPEKIYSDEVVNIIVDTVYPAVLNAFEDLWGTLPTYAEAPSSGVTANVSVKTLHACLASTASADTIKKMALYPDLLANTLTGGLATTFATAKAQLAATAAGTNWGVYPTNIWNNPAIRTITTKQVQKIDPETFIPVYDTSGNPVMLTVTEQGPLKIDWGVNAPEPGSAFEALSLEERFRQALAAALTGIYPLLASLLLGQSFSAHSDSVATMNGNAFAYGGGCCNTQATITSTIFLNLTVATGNDGYAKLLTPILETLMGTDAAGLATIPTITDMRNTSTYNSSRKLVDAIFDPVKYFLDEKLAKQPLQTLVDLLPNLSYAISMNRVLPLLDELNLDLTYVPDGDVMAAGGISNQGSLTNNGMNLAGNVSINVGQMLLSGDGGPDLSFLSDMNKLLAMVGDALGVTLPILNAGELSTLGELNTLSDSKTLTGTRRLIDSTQPDVLLYVLRYLLGALKEPDIRGMLDATFADAGMSGDLLNTVNGILSNVTTTPEDAIAALVELVSPQAYAVNPVAYGEPALAADHYPAWWGDLSAGAAKRDGKYLIDNADVIADLIWSEIMGHPGMSFGDELDKLLRGKFANKAGFVDDIHGIQNTIQNLLAKPEVAKILSDYDFLFQNLVINDSVHVDLLDIVDQLLAYNPATAHINQSVGDFVNAFADFLAPAGPLLDFLLAGAPLGLLDVTGGAGGSLITVLGYNGYENALIPLLKTFTEPLGLNGSIINQADFTALGTDYAGKFKAILAPLVAVYNKLLEKPTANLLELIPNVVYYLSKDKDDGPSPLQQSLDTLLKPLYQVLDTARPIADVLGMLQIDDLPAGLTINNTGVRVDAIALINNIAADALADLAGGLPLTFNLDLSQFLVGEWQTTWVKADKAALLFALLDAAGVLDYISENGYESLTYLIQHQKLPDFAKIDYAKAPAAATVTYPAWFPKTKAAFLTDNADAVVKWAWKVLLSGNAEGKAYLVDLLRDLGVTITIEDTLEQTVQGLFGNDLYVKDNLTLLVKAVLSLKDQLDGIEMPSPPFAAPGTTLADVLKQVVLIGNAPLDLDAVFAPFAAYDAAAVTISNEADFKAQLTTLFTPALPLLRLFLAGNDLKIITDPAITHDDDPANHTFLELYGYEGYETGLLPLLAALGADVPGYLNTLVPYSTFETASDADQIAAIIDPILFLFNALAKNPGQTVLHVLPNVAYLVSDANAGTQAGSVLQQVAVRLLAPLTSIVQARMTKAELAALTGKLGAADEIGALLANALFGTLDMSGTVNGFLADQLPQIGLKKFTLEDFVVGAVTKLPSPLNEIGMNDAASFVKVDEADLLMQILSVTGALDLISDNGLGGLVNLLNDTDQPGPGRPNYIVYPTVNTEQVKYPSLWWRKKDADYITEHSDEYLDTLWQILYGKPFGSLPLEAGKEPIDSFLRDTLGSALYTQQNFDQLLNMVKGFIPAIEDITLLPGRTLGALLESIVAVGGKSVDVLGIIKHLTTWTPDGPITNEASFIKGLLDYLEPAMPVLAFMLTNADISVLNDASINGGKDFLKAFGYDGYRLGLIPLYEALLMPLDAIGQVTTPEQFKALGNRAQLEALLQPLLYVIEQLVGSPFETLLKIAPNMSYFISATTGAPKSLLQESVDRILFALNNVTKEVLGSELVQVDISQLLDDALQSLELRLDLKLLNDLTYGKLVDYASFSGGLAKYVRLDPADRANILTVTLRTVLKILEDKAARTKIVQMLGEAAGIKGFALKILDFTLGIRVWFMKISPNGIEFTIHRVLQWAKAMTFFAPMIFFIQKVFATIGGWFK